MARFITQFSGEAPDVPLLKTLSLDFTHKPAEEYGGLSTEFFKSERFPWLNLAVMTDTQAENEALGRFAVELQEPHNGTTRCLIGPAETNQQRIINREGQYYVSRYEQRDPANGIPELLYHDTDNALTFRTMPTPDAFKDKAVGNLDAYEIVSYDHSTRIIRVKGLVYDRTEPTEDGTYQRGKHMGLNSFLRDLLTSDNHSRDLRWKLNRHDYGNARLVSSNLRITYDQIIDETFPDPRVANGDSNPTPTFHTIRVREDLNPQQRPQAGDRIQLLRRQAFISPAATSGHTFSQKYWMLEADMQLAKSMWQFFAIFGWSQYQETVDGIGFTDDLGEEAKSREIDIVEIPAGDKRWRFHNAHAPRGGQFNLSEVEGRQALMPDLGTEWDSDTSQQHQIAQELGPDYTSERVVFRQYWWPPGNDAGKPGNSLEWYVKDADGVFKRLGGCLAPAFWSRDLLTNNQLFFSAAAHGDFFRGLSYVFSSPTDSPDVRDFVNKIYKLEVFQFEGEVAGGSGAPGPSGRFVRSPGPTPGDVSGGSGTGVVVLDDSNTPIGVGPVTEFDESIETIIHATKLVVPIVGKSYPLTSRLIRNTQGYGVTFDWSVNAQSGYDATIVADTADGEHATLTFTQVPNMGAEQTVALLDFVQVNAVEASGPGTAPIIRGATVRTSSAGDVPDEGTGATPGTTGNVTVNPSISVSDRGPTISGSVIDITSGSELRIQTSTGSIFYATVNAAGNFAFEDFGTGLNNESMTILYDSLNNGVVQSTTFNYENAPAAASTVQIVRWEIQNVVAGSVTAFLGLSENRPARIRFGTDPNNLDQSRIITSDNSQGLDNGTPHIYAVTPLTSGTLYYFQADDHVNGTYTTEIISGTPD